MKANEWLVQNGYKEKITRGRQSAINISRLDHAVSKGIVFDDYPKVKAVFTAAPKPVTSKPRIDADIVADIPYRFPEGQFRAIEFRDGKRVERSLRSACNLCRVSLVNCWCSEPVIVAHDGRGSVRVYIESVA